MSASIRFYYLPFSRCISHETHTHDKRERPNYLVPVFLKALGCTQHRALKHDFTVKHSKVQSYSHRVQITYAIREKIMNKVGKRTSKENLGFLISQPHKASKLLTSFSSYFPLFNLSSSLLPPSPNLVCQCTVTIHYINMCYSILTIGLVSSIYCMNIVLF